MSEKMEAKLLHMDDPRSTICKPQSATSNPRVTDNDSDEITVSLDGRELRGWSYKDDAERRIKMQMAHEFAEGWFQATKPQPERG